MEIHKPPVQSIAQVSDLIEGMLVYLIVLQKCVGWYKLKSGAPNPSVDFLMPSERCQSVTNSDYYLVHSGLSSIEREYMQYKLDSFVLAKRGINRVELFNKGFICVASAATTPKAAVNTGKLQYVCEVEGHNFYHYIVPYLCGTDESLSYDTYPVVNINKRWCSIYDFANMQEHQSAEENDLVKRLVEKLHTDLSLDLSTVELFKEGPLGEMDEK